ncbi:MAG: hypothetical protein M0R51_13120 [Clostridia bacterium]|jgi:hypothetical protein|nr:hypothetical protein [Clostridia bacterium]
MPNGLKKAWFNFQHKTYYDCDVYHNEIYVKNHVEVDNGQSIIRIPGIGYFEVPNREKAHFKKKNGIVVVVDAESITPYEMEVRRTEKLLKAELNDKIEPEKISNNVEEEPKPKKKLSRKVKDKIEAINDNSNGLEMIQRLDYVTFKEATLSPKVFKENIEADTVADLQHGETTFMEALAPQLPSIIFGVVALVALYIGGNLMGAF